MSDLGWLIQVKPVGVLTLQSSVETKTGNLMLVTTSKAHTHKHTKRRPRQVKGEGSCLCGEALVSGFCGVCEQ